MKKNFFKFAALMMAAATLVVACSDDKTEGGNGAQNALGAPVVFLERDGVTLNVEWEYVSGATAYKVSAYEIGTVDNEGNTTTYTDEAMVKSLGDKETEFLSTSYEIEKGYYYRVDVVATAAGKNDSEVGSGTASYYVAAMMYEGGDIAAQVLADVAEKPATEELEITLLVGGEYTLDAELDFGQHPTTIIVKKWNNADNKYENYAAGDARPVITFGQEGSFRVGKSFSMSNVSVDAEKQNITAPSHGVVYNAIVRTSAIADNAAETAKNVYLVSDVTFDNCWFKDVPQSFVSIGEVLSWAIDKLTINNCIVQMNNTLGGNTFFINGNGSGLRSIDEGVFGENGVWGRTQGAVRELTITNTTAFCTNPSAKFYAFHFGNNFNGQLGGTFDSSATGFCKIENCTFAQLTPNQNFANKTPNADTWPVSLVGNVFYDTQRVWKLAQGNNVNVTGSTISGNYLEFNLNGDDQAIWDGENHGDWARLEAGFVFGTVGLSSSNCAVLDLTKENAGVSFATATGAGDPRWK